MKILFITASLGMGGAEKQLCFVAESLATRGHEIHIVNLQSITGKIGYQRALSDKISIYTAPISGKRGLQRLEQIRFIKKTAKQVGAELLVGYTLYPNAMAQIVGDMLHIPAIMSERGDPNCTFDKSIVSRMLFSIINRCEGGVFQTLGAMDYYKKGMRERGTVIANPIFVDQEPPYVSAKEREKTVVSVGRLDNFQKRYDVMLDSFAIFSKIHPEYRLKLYGTGNDEETIRAWCKEKGVADQIDFMGVTTSPIRDIAKDGMFLITSDFEGISNALLEAMAAGLPCVSTDHTPGGARLLIEDGKNGLLAPVQNPQKLADAMCHFAEDEELAERCGVEARKVIHRFAPETIVDQWENYCMKILESRK